MKRAVTISFAFALAIAGGAYSTTEPPPQRAAQQAAQPKSMDAMPMHEMMRQCMGHCQVMSDAAGKLRSTVAQARASNDPAKMRAALEQVQAHFAAAEQRMAGCMNMMGQGEHGMMDHGNMDHGADAAR